MLKSDLKKQLSHQLPHLSEKLISQAVDLIFETLTQALRSKRRIEIRGFGCFSLHHHQARNARNPKTGEQLVMNEKLTPHFKPSKEWILQLNAAESISKSQQ